MDMLSLVFTISAIVGGGSSYGYIPSLVKMARKSIISNIF